MTNEEALTTVEHAISYLLEAGYTHQEINEACDYLYAAHKAVGPCGEIKLGMGPTDGGMSLAPNGFEAAVIRARVQESRLLANRSCERYDYEKQAWTVNWRYMSCNHPRAMQCKCYGRLHEGELAEDFRNRTLQSEHARATQS